MSVVVTFRVETFVDARGEFGREQYSQFDQALGDAFVRVAHTPQVWRQATVLGRVDPASFDLTFSYASQWRTVFENVRLAANWVSTLTGSPVVTLLAENILDHFLPRDTRRRISISDVMVDDVPAEQWLEQLDAEDREEARKAILEAVEASRVPTGPPPKYLTLLASPWGIPAAVALFLVVATLWTTWDAFIRRQFERLPPAPQIEVSASLTQSHTQTAGDEPQTEPRVERRCISVRVQRGVQVEMVCAPTN